MHWAVWVDLAFNITDTIGNDRMGIATSNMKIGEVFSLLVQPSLLFELMGEINKVGVWGIRGGTVSGGFLTFIWVIEILLAAIVAVVTGIDQAAKPYCEQEEIWFQEEGLNPVAHFEDGAAFVKALSIGDMDVINANLKPAGDIKTESYATMVLYDAKSGENFISIENNIAKLNDKKETKFDTDIVTSFLKISQDVANRLKGK